MRIDESGRHELARGIDRLVRGQRETSHRLGGNNVGNAIVLNEHVSLKSGSTRTVDYSSIVYESRHSERGGG